MMPSHPWFDGPNGRYDICWDCATRYGYRSEESRVMGVWSGDCDLCGTKHTGLTNAYHDWGLTDAECEAIIAGIFAD